MKKIQARVIQSTVLLLTMLMMAITISHPPVYADSASVIKGGICDASSGGTCPENPGDNINETIASVINLLSVITGVIAVIMIIFGGFRYITSGGASDKITSAKNTLVYAIIGLIIVALAQVIVRFVLSNTTNAAPSIGATTGGSSNKTPSASGATGPHGAQAK